MAVKSLQASRQESHDSHISSGTLEYFLVFLPYAYFVAPAFSTPAVGSCIFHPCDLLLHFLLLHFPPLQYAPAFSAPFPKYHQFWPVFASVHDAKQYCSPNVYFQLWLHIVVYTTNFVVRLLFGSIHSTSGCSSPSTAQWNRLTVISHCWVLKCGVYLKVIGWKRKCFMSLNSNAILWAMQYCKICIKSSFGNI